jgi:hypothetical protein
MPTINFPPGVPIVLMVNRHPDPSTLHWGEPYSFRAAMATDVIIQIQMANRSVQNPKWFRYWVEVVDTSNNVISTVASAERYVSDFRIDEVRLTLSSQVLRFRVRAQNFWYYQYIENPPPNHDNRVWRDEEVNYYTVFVTYFGDFSLDYVPITILYDPPYQDWVNALTQNEQYGTRITVGTKQTSGSGVGSSESVSGGITIGIPDKAGITQSGSVTDEYTGSESATNAASNRVTFRYEFGSTLIADNQRAIGRAYWGALSDLFVLLKNPWFSVSGDEEGNPMLAVSDRCSLHTHIVIVPAHRLLRPGTDPVASAIPASTRRRILDLDPFIVNLDRFFPVDTGVPLSDAVDQYADPAGGATLIAEYALSNGVELDLTAISELTVEDTYTRETTYAAEVSQTTGMSSTFQGQYLYFAGEIGVSGSSSNSRFVELRYQASAETTLGLIKTAKCQLIRNV